MISFLTGLVLTLVAIYLILCIGGFFLGIYVVKELSKKED